MHIIDIFVNKVASIHIYIYVLKDDKSLVEASRSVTVAAGSGFQINRKMEWWTSNCK
jgi:hypothetical protein